MKLGNTNSSRLWNINPARKNPPVFQETTIYRIKNEEILKNDEPHMKASSPREVSQTKHKYETDVLKRIFAF